MALGRFREAVTDLKETLRRVFQDPPVQGEAPSIHFPAPSAASLLEARATGVEPRPLARVSGDSPVLREIHWEEIPVGLEARLQAEQGWEGWTAGARSCSVPVFHASAADAVTIPPLPRRAGLLKVSLEGWRTRVQAGPPRLPACAVRRLEVALAGPRVRDGLALARSLPVAVPGEAWAVQGKALQMRYALELVKATGENIRNVEVLGLFRIPDEGVLEMRHDPRNQRLLLRLDGKARTARRRPFLLARRRVDGVLVSCFLEQG